MTAVMKYAGAFSLDELENEVRRGMERPASETPTREQTVKKAARQARSASTPSYESLLSFGVLNIAGFALVGAAWSRGWVDMVVAADTTGLTFAIFGVFLVGLALCGLKLLRVGREAVAARSGAVRAGTWASDYLDSIRGRDSGARAIAASSLRLRLGDWIVSIRHFGNSLVLLGLIGTVIGFIISLSGVDANAVSDVNAISPMVSKLLSGMSVALYTTLAGAMLNLWLMVNHRLLAGATARFVASLVERGESDECA